MQFYIRILRVTTAIPDLSSERTDEQYSRVGFIELYERGTRPRLKPTLGVYRSRVSCGKNGLLEVPKTGGSNLRTILTSSTYRRTMRRRIVPFPAGLKLFPVSQIYFRSENVVTKSTANALRNIFLS